MGWKEANNMSFIEDAVRQALDEQVERVMVPRSVIRSAEGAAGSMCPTCRKHVMPPWGYCPHCGQKLDWD